MSSIKKILANFNLENDLDDFDNIHQTILKDIVFKETNLWLLMFAIVIASVGLNMKFGVIWKMLTPYCHCKEPLKVGQYILGGVMPAVILGIIPCIIAIIIGHFGLLLFGIFFTMYNDLPTQV